LSYYLFNKADDTAKINVVVVYTSNTDDTFTQWKHSHIQGHISIVSYLDTNKTSIDKIRNHTSAYYNMNLSVRIVFTIFFPLGFFFFSAYM